jgi:hypothetical protein
MAQEVAEAMGRFHPGRPAFSALSRAEGALRLAAQEVEIARRTYAPVAAADAPSDPFGITSPARGRGRGEG